MEPNANSQDDAYLKLFADGDETEAARAYDWLSERARPILLGYMRKQWTNLPVSEHEDIVQDALLKVWSVRANFRYSGYRSWLAFLRTIAYHEAIDRRNDPVPALLPEDDDLEDNRAAWTMQLPIEFLQRLTPLLNAHWLGAEPTSLQQTTQLLAAQLHYLDRTPKERVLSLLQRSRPTVRERNAWTPAALEETLRRKGTLLLLAYATLHYANERLFKFWLGWEERALEGASAWEAALQELPQEDIPHGWTRTELDALFARYVLELKAKAIQERTGLSAVAIATLLDSSTKPEPFTSKAEELLNALAEGGVGEREAILTLLAEPGLWHRLAVEYWYRDDLPLKEVYARMAGAAKILQVKITEGQLNMWLSGGRLAKELLKVCEEKGILP